ncbi:3-deoxy-D-manno-octulosonic acid transferase [Thiomicrorhabdus immobilis]|uniref:3-deoxy-D-manno-octulosonic acid transferase n=1 Tax=Thiomicrorhabdus immobilis TaxID=2791037 RepID=A0ABN6D0I6_9GAMM|nr:glycosyltransferase N-terminal domain-containing protein [Thiomicrorhabdus immobilis]BCN94419.1 3-deoxy-D-manno-octulosonic acid transferase [Thiomicrorhabdus immobilis]
MLVYQVLIRLLSPLIWLLIVVEAVKSKDGKRFFFEKFGLRFPTTKNASKNPIWIHCASVGEVKAAEPLIRALIPKHNILITTNTTTSKSLISDLYGEQVEHCYLPFDWPYALRRFINHYSPSRLWVMETEIWPNLFRVAEKRKIPVSILNGRLTAKTFKTPNWLQAAYRISLRRVNKVIARTQKDADMFIKLGANTQQIEILGNLKYSAQPEAQAQIRPIERPFILAASTHEDEELQITQAWLDLKRPELLVIVPRHPKRSGSIQKQLAFLGTTLKVASKNEQPNSETRLFLDDRIGKLLPLYAHAQIVIMGGSFVAKGGHNILEPAAFKKPILSGMDCRDFEDEMQLLQTHNGILQVADYSEFKDKLQQLLQDPALANQMGESAYLALQSQKDTLKNYLSALKITE